MPNLKQSTMAILEGDYTKYPESIRETLPRLAGEVFELRGHWGVYSRFFMETKEFTDTLEEGLGDLLNMLQTLLEEQMLLSISRLTEKSSHAQKNISLWSLSVAISNARDASSFGGKVEDSLNQIYDATANVRHHRHKRIAHFDLSVGLGDSILPEVTYGDILKLLEQIEAFLNLFWEEFEGTQIFFDTLSTLAVIGQAEVTIYKARAYDLLESEGAIPDGEWRRRAEK